METVIGPNGDVEKCGRCGSEDVEVSGVLVFAIFGFDFYKCRKCDQRWCYGNEKQLDNLAETVIHGKYDPEPAQKPIAKRLERLRESL